MGGDVFAGQVDDGIDARELGGVDHSGGGIPADFVSLGARRTADDRANEVAVGLQRTCQRACRQDRWNL